jgi:hypothetical protein
MASLATSGMRVAGDLDATWADQQYFAVLGISLVFLNVFTFLYHFSGSTAFNAFGNAIGIALIAYSIRAIFRSQRHDAASRSFLLSAFTMISLSVIFNWAVASVVVALKYLSIYIFYCAGRACGGRIRPIELYCMCALAALPIIFLPTGSSKAFANESFFDEVFAYLPNANTAVLYFSALLFVAAQQYGNRVIPLQFLNAVLMNKVGAVLATAVAVCVWIAFPLRRESIAGFILVAICGFIAFALGAFDRMIAMFDNLVLVFDMGHAASTMSYKELVQLTKSTDVSAFFRIIHWSNIWDLYSSQGILTLIFGYGAGQTAPLTYAELVPHNDYIRILAEYGFINLIVFVIFLLHIHKTLTTGATKVLFVVLCIYFFSENLLDNFTSMALYFAYAGRLASASNRELSQAQSKRLAVMRIATERRKEAEIGDGQIVRG